MEEEWPYSANNTVVSYEKHPCPNTIDSLVLSHNQVSLSLTMVGCDFLLCLTKTETVDCGLNRNDRSA